MQLNSVPGEMFAVTKVITVYRMNKAGLGLNNKYNDTLHKGCLNLNNNTEGPPSGAPYSSCRGKIKETHELIFSWLSWLAVLLVGAYARRRRRRSCPTWQPYSKNETYSLSLRFTSLILDIPAMIN